MLAHCQRKLSGENYLPAEDHDHKAFGLLGGRITNEVIEVINCQPLLHNARQSDIHKDYMDRMMAAHALPSITPFTERGWVASPDELTRVLQSYRKLNLILIGTYHMHRVPWEQDQVRDKPTALDTILGGSSRLMMFIVSMVNPANPILRAFYEGDTNREFPIH